MNRRSFIKLFTGGLLGAGLLPMVGGGEPCKPIPIESLRSIRKSMGRFKYEPEKPITIEQLRACRDEMKRGYKIKPMVGSVTEVNGCTVLRIEQGDEVSYFSDVDNIDEKSFTEWADKENLHWDNIALA